MFVIKNNKTDSCLVFAKRERLYLHASQHLSTMKRIVLLVLLAVTVRFAVAKELKLTE